MKRNFKNVLLFLLCFITVFTFVGCGVEKVLSPQDVIEKEYGDTQFKISFDSSSLEEPLRDVFYSAKNMPVLPTPKKVGFVFAGWYFNSSLTEPCNVSDGDLYWKMKDLTLYPKWEEEKIVNNGTYEIEYNAEIVEGSVTEGLLAQGYQKFPEDIIKSETYIEKNDKGTFLRIQYDNVVRGPVLGSSGSDENNFSKMTYTVTDLDNRIDESISIIDRTNNIQTLYYNIDGLKLTDTITFYIDYYNWKIDIADKDRNKASVSYKVAFNITRFVGFDQAFINPEGRMENGIYLIPTHYTGLDKSMAMLDKFNPVYAYIEAINGHYKLYKPLNSYNNDFPNITPEQYPLRTSGYAREFACFYVNKDKKVSKEVEKNEEGNYFIPEEIHAEKYIPLTYEFHADTGRYYYSVDLGDTLDNDLIFIGGSAGAMEQMFSYPFSYRRLSLDYNSMVRIVDWDYKPLSGDSFVFKDKVAFYPGSVEDFDDSNTDFDIYQTYRQSINMTNVFFANTKNGKKVFDTKMTIIPLSAYPMAGRYKYAYFDIHYFAYGYDPMKDEDLLARELVFNTNGKFKNSNSFINTKKIGKTFNIGDDVLISEIYKEKVVDNEIDYQYQAYSVGNDLKVDFNNKIDIPYSFKFSKNIAVLFTSKDIYNRSTLVYIMEKQDPCINIKDENESIVWKKSTDDLYETTARFAIGEEGGVPIKIPEITYTYYGIEYSTGELKKYDDENKCFTDFTKVSAWEYNHGKYKSLIINSGDRVDFCMPSEKVRVLVQIINPFGEVETIQLEYRGQQAGEYYIKLNDGIVSSGDIKYKGNVRNKINFQMYETFNIINSEDISNIPEKFVLELNDTNQFTSENLDFNSAIIYLQDNTVTVNNISDIWNVIKDHKYALIHLCYSNSYGDSILYKAQYNFHINSFTLDNYSFINESRTIFTGERIVFRNPIITSSDFTSIHNGAFKVYIKNGNDYEFVNKEQLAYDDDGYRASVQFKIGGDYLLTWEYELYKDEYGQFIFNANRIDDLLNVLTINVCQKIEVVDVNSNMEITYVTDLDHPFDKESDELVGYTFREDSEYQYASINVRNSDHAFALSRNSFVMFNDNDSRVKDKLFSWKSKTGERIINPGYLINGINKKMGTVNPVLYAEWDSGVTIDVFSDAYGEIKKESSVYLQKDTVNYRNYQLAFSSLSVKVPEGYVIYGWRASKAIFTEKVIINGVEKRVPSNFHKGINGSIIFDEKIDFTAVLKKLAYVTYEAYDEEISSKVDFKNSLEADYGIFVGDRFNDFISDNKLEEISKVHIKDQNKSFKRWEIYDNNQGVYVKVDLSNLIIDEQYINKNGKIILRAVFG